MGQQSEVCSQHFQHSMDEPGTVPNPARGQLNWKKCVFLFFPFAPDNWSREAGWVVPSRVSVLILHTQAESGDFSRDSSRFPRRRPFIYTVIRHRVNTELSGHAIAYQWRSLPRVRRHRTSCSQGSSSNGCRIFSFHNKSVFIRLSFPTPTIMNWIGTN